MNERTSGPVPDGTKNPYVLDVDDVWHRRPADDEWTSPLGDPEQAQAHTVCGQKVHSTEVSSHEPGPRDLEDDQRFCRACDEVHPWSLLTTF